MKALWLVIGGYTAAWGLWILNPFWESFSPEAGLYSVMADFMPEWAWGLHALVIGISMIYGVVYHWPRGLWWGRVAGSYHWALIGLFYGFGDIKNTGMITAFTAVLYINVLWKITPHTPQVHPLDSHG